MENVNVLVETIGLSNEEWLRYRQNGIGGSDVAPILGISKWSSAIEIWLSKTNQKQNDVIENESMTWGKILEPVIRERFREVTGKKVVEVHAILQSTQYPYMIADIDGLTEDDNGEPAILECKCVSEYKRSEWEDGIPVYYATQVQHYLAVTGLKTCYVAALIGGNTFVIREVHADPELQQMLIAVEADFWKKCVNMERPEPDGSEACTNLLNSIYRGGVEEEIIMPDHAVEWVDRYIEASAQEDSAKAVKNECANHLREIMGDFDKARCYEHTITWKPVTTERLDSKALKENEPDVYKKYCKTSTSRRFTVK